MEISRPHKKGQLLHDEGARPRPSSSARSRLSQASGAADGSDAVNKILATRFAANPKGSLSPQIPLSIGSGTALANRAKSTAPSADLAKPDALLDRSVPTKGRRSLPWSNRSSSQQPAAQERRRTLPVIKPMNHNPWSQIKVKSPRTDTKVDHDMAEGDGTLTKLEEFAADWKGLKPGGAFAQHSSTKMPAVMVDVLSWSL